MFPLVGPELFAEEEIRIAGAAAWRQPEEWTSDFGPCGAQPVGVVLGPSVGFGVIRPSIFDPELWTMESGSSHRDAWPSEGRGRGSRVESRARNQRPRAKVQGPAPSRQGVLAGAPVALAAVSVVVGATGEVAVAAASRCFRKNCRWKTSTLRLCSLRFVENAWDPSCRATK